ncbi:MAG: T9SS type A sorting domain-containing protein [Bacteroidetes bacterium]|nr:T9SS type A sorting domain-containing protein [Bacteroidota bacterium]
MVKPATLKIDICAVDGHLVNSSIVQLSAGVQNVAIRSSDLQLDAGVYIVRFMLEGEAKTIKMIVRP